MKVSVYDELCGDAEFTVDELKALAPLHLSLKDRVQGVEGKAFDLLTWYGAWRQRQLANTDRTPVYMEVEAVDEFQAKIPWEQLGQAAFLYEQTGEPLKKGFPIRLYVPDGSSECLNVKSVVKIKFSYHGSSAEASYGFKNQVSIEDLKLKK
ncbi:molybdopterin-dependent oxidoreductase [Paenibacillus sp. LMG 31456]|uniref:Molybdopterin-dependent oxidoreductase n=1 Tax=Paenibacillus foliorum TaxID=2654974 RepID=A0A972GXD9_9BACL|nr:molybdopterin-dependent oxidoreductase [Paenibacillus foliorum]NOU92296.1 molybdopterin-dependent oxidoreductase [Paenibacillus foliorum]